MAKTWVQSANNELAEEPLILIFLFWQQGADYAVHYYDGFMSIEEELQNPATMPERLAIIAQVRPDLHAEIYSHPNCYPDLQEWIVQQSLASQSQSQLQPQSQSQPQPQPQQQSQSQPVAQYWTQEDAGPAQQFYSPKPKRNKATLFTALGLGLALLLSVGVNVWQLGTQRSAAVAETFSSSPEEAFNYMIEQWAKGDFFGAASACVGKTAGENVDLDAHIKRLTEWNSNLPVWSDEPGFWQEHAASNIRDRCQSSISSATAQMLAPDFNKTVSVPLDDGKSLRDQWSFEPMGSLSVVSFDTVEWDPDSRINENAKLTYEYLGGLEIAHAMALIDVDGTTWLVGPSFIRYEKGWALLNPVQGTPGSYLGFYDPMAVSESEYQDKLAEIRAADGSD